MNKGKNKGRKKERTNLWMHTNLRKGRAIVYEHGSIDTARRLQ
jgi:hypothetical protein